MLTALHELVKNIAENAAEVTRDGKRIVKKNKLEKFITMLQHFLNMDNDTFNKLHF